jgi:hypothetical protein
MLNNAAEFLGSAWQESGNISEGHNWNLECITEPDEPGSFDTGINVEAAG